MASSETELRQVRHGLTKKEAEQMREPGVGESCRRDGTILKSSDASEHTLGVAGLMDQHRLRRRRRPPGRRRYEFSSSPGSCAIEVTVLQGHTAVVTGASRGIGKEIALELERNGYRVAVTSVQRSGVRGGTT